MVKREIIPKTGLFSSLILGEDMILYHGTSAESAKKIIEGGFYPIQNNWTCSGNDIFFYQENEDYSEHDCIYNAFGNGCIASSLQRSDSSYASVLLCSVPDDIVFPDDSCQNMDNSVMIHNHNKNKIQIIEEKKYRYYHELIPHYIAGVFQPELLNMNFPKDLWYLIHDNLDKFNLIDELYELNEYDY